MVLVFKLLVLEELVLEELVLVCNQDTFDLRKELRIWEVVVCNQDKFDIRKEGYIQVEE